MRIYILNRDTELQAKTLTTWEIVETVRQGHLILQCLIGTDEPDVTGILHTIPEVQMWCGHEAALYDYICMFMDEFCRRVNTGSREDRALMSGYQKFLTLQNLYYERLFDMDASNYEMTTPVQNASQKLIDSHVSAFVAELPRVRMKYFPSLRDLSVPYQVWLD